MKPTLLVLVFVLFFNGVISKDPTLTTCEFKTTTSGNCCSIPFIYKEVTYNACTKADYHRLWCSLDTVYKGRWENCLVPCPVNTTSGKCCSFPFEYEGVTYKDCTKVKHHRPWCSLDAVYKGRWGNCQVPCPIKTISDKCCRFPFEYKGVTHKDCIKADHHRPWCSLDAVYNGKRGDCQVPCSVKTTSDSCCRFPFKYKGVTYNDCTKVEHHRPWCSLDAVYNGRWGNCLVPCSVNTTSGKCCSFPFEYEGVTYKDCTKVKHHRPWCSLDAVYKGRWGNCQVPCAVKTTSDSCCRFPFKYKGGTYNDCTKVEHHRAWCSLDAVYNGRWGNCHVTCPVKTTSGKCCIFPFNYKGVTYMDCTKANHHRPWCSLDPMYNGKWGNCQVPCAVKTTSGKCCSFPFKYKGVSYNDCTKAGNQRPWCSLDSVFKGRWANCNI